MTRRKEIVDAVATALNQISVTNGYSTNFSKITYWQDTDIQYGFNHLNYRDTTEEYSRKNTVYDTNLSIEIAAIVYGVEKEIAQELGTLALADIIAAVRSMVLPQCLFDLARSHKWVETKGKTAVCVELELIARYKF